MTANDQQIVDEIFSAALELDAEERARFVDGRCAGNKTLKNRILKLLAAAEEKEGLLDNQLGIVRERMMASVFQADDEDRKDAEDLSGQRIDAWRLDQRLARGGLATVYLAHRDDGEYDQRAAFKVLRRGLDTDDLVARFRVERQILSALEHPGIANILDGGALGDGRPYLVVEFVDGKTITDHSREANLPLRDRIGLMQQVLRSLQHAHRHLIVHRDIKPSNVLVSTDGHVSLLDFGIAKLLDPEALPGASKLTRTGMSMLTPGYCSPEQHAGDAVTTASDIYQSGAVLFELLTGTRPRVVSDNDTSDVPAPSSLLKGKTGYNSVRGDLDAIVQKAMHTDPVQRYSSAEEMDADLQRFLDGRPVLAQPDSLGYRVRKLHKRKPWLIPSTLVAGLVTVGFVFTLVNVNRDLRIEQQGALEAQNFLVEVLSSADPFRPADPELGSDITVVEALDLGVKRLETELVEDYELRASVLVSIADVYASLDRHEHAIALREEALAIQKNVFGVASEPVLASLRMLSREYLALDEYATATNYAREQLQLARELYSGNEPIVGAAEANAAEVAARVGDFDESRTLFELGLEKMRQAPVEFGQDLIDALTSLARQLEFEEPETSFALLAEAQERAENLYGANSLQMAQVRSALASLYSATRQYEKAEQEFVATISIFEAELGHDHGETLEAAMELGILYNRMELPAKAEAVYNDTLERIRLKYGENHRKVADAYQNLATVLTRIGRYEQSIPMHEKAFEIYNLILPQDQPVVAYPLLSKAFAEVNGGQHEAAETTARTALEIVEQTAPGTYLEGVARCLIARSLEGQGDPAANEMMSNAHGLLIDSVVSDTYRLFCRVPESRAITAE